MSVDTQVAAKFGHFLAQGDYVGAHSLLTTDARAVHSPADLRNAVKSMLAYVENGPITEVSLVSECVLEDWPDKQTNDVGYVYVALDGKGFSEAGTVILASEADEIRIRDLEWGRP